MRNKVLKRKKVNVEGQEAKYVCKVCSDLDIEKINWGSGEVTIQCTKCGFVLEFVR